MPYHGFFTPLRRLVIEKVTAFQEQCDFFTAPWTKQLALVATDRAASMADLEQPALPSAQHDYSYSGDKEHSFFDSRSSRYSAKQESSDSLAEKQSATNLDAAHNSTPTLSHQNRANGAAINSEELDSMHQNSSANQHSPNLDVSKVHSFDSKAIASEVNADKSTSSQDAKHTSSDSMASESTDIQTGKDIALASATAADSLGKDELLKISSTHGVAYAFRNIRIDNTQSPTDAVDQQDNGQNNNNSAQGFRYSRPVKTNRPRRPHVRFDIRARRLAAQNASANNSGSTAPTVVVPNSSSSTLVTSGSAISTQVTPNTVTSTRATLYSAETSRTTVDRAAPSRTTIDPVDMVRTNAALDEQTNATDKLQTSHTSDASQASGNTANSITTATAAPAESSVASSSKHALNLDSASNAKSNAKDARNTEPVKSERHSEANLYSQLLRESQKQDNVLTPALSAEDLAQIEALRQKYSDGMMDFENGGSISELSTQMGLGRLGEDDSDTSEHFVAHDASTGSKQHPTFATALNKISLDRNTSHEGELFNERLGSARTITSPLGMPALHKDALSNGDDGNISSAKVSPRVLAASASLLPDAKNELLASVVHPDQFSADSASLMRIENISLRHQDVMHNELQFKAGFSMQGHLPGSILYVHNEHKVYVDPVAASQLGFDVKKALDNKASKELYPSRRRFQRPVESTTIQESKVTYESQETKLTNGAKETHLNAEYNALANPESKAQPNTESNAHYHSEHHNVHSLDRNAEHYRIDQNIRNSVASKQQSIGSNSSISSTTAVSFTQQDQSWLTHHTASQSIAANRNMAEEQSIAANQNLTDKPNVATSREEALSQNELVKAVISSAGFALDTSDTNQLHKLNKVALAEHAKAAIKSSSEQQQIHNFTVSGNSINHTAPFTADVDLMTAAAEVAHPDSLRIPAAELSANTDLSDKLSVQSSDNLSTVSSDKLSAVSSDKFSTVSSDKASAKLSGEMGDNLQPQVNTTSNSQLSTAALTADHSNLTSEKLLDKLHALSQDKLQDKLQNLHELPNQNNLQENLQEKFTEIPIQKLNEATRRGVNIWQYRGLGSNSEAQLELISAPQMSSLGRKSGQNMGVPSLKFLHLLGREITSKLFFYLRLLHKAPSCLNPLHCRIEACPFGRKAAQREARHCPYVNVEQTPSNAQVNRAPDSISFEVKLNKPNGTQYYLYIRATAFYEPSGKLLALSFNLSQQASRYFALIPNVVADNSSFDWHIPSQRRVFSPNFYRVLGYPVNSPDVPTFMPDWIRTMIHPDEQNRLLDFINNIDALRHNDCYEMYYRLKRADGNYFWTKITGVVFARDAEGHALRIIGSLSNINHVVDSYEKIRNKIYTDVLTGLKNRAYMHSQLPFLLHPLQQPLGIIFVDATALKLYNDYLSHTTGDRLLITLTALLNHTIPSPKDLVRLSGDEFVCLIPNCSSERLKKIESAIIESRTQYNNKAPVRMPVFFSFGSSVLDLRDSLYANRPELLQLKADEPLPSNIMPDAKELFYLAVQASDLQMQFYKRHNKQMHYELIKAYIENILQYSISLNDSRISMTINK